MFGSVFGAFGSLIFTIVAALVSGFLLWLTAKLFKLKGGFGTAFVVALIVGVVNWAIGFVFGFIPLVGAWLGGVISFVVSIILGIMLIKSKYKQDTGKAVVVWLVWFVLSMVATFILAFIAGVLFVGASLVTGAGSMMFGG